MRITSKGQITIPSEYRRKLGLLPETEIAFELRADGVLLKKSRSETKTRAGEHLERIRGSATVKLSTEEILSLTRDEGE